MYLFLGDVQECQKPDRISIIYEQLKSSYNPKRLSAMNDEDKNEPRNKTAAIKQLIGLIKEIDMYKQKIMYNYILIGRNIEQLMNKYKVSNSALDNIFKNYKGFSRPMRSKYMSLYNLAMKYNKLMFICPTSVAHVLNNLSKLEEKIVNDAEFDWK